MGWTLWVRNYHLDVLEALGHVVLGISQDVHEVIGPTDLEIQELVCHKGWYHWVRSYLQDVLSRADQGISQDVLKGSCPSNLGIREVKTSCP